MSKRKTLSNRLKTANFKNLVFLFYVLLVLSASIRCANIQQPTGGPKDTIPPVLLHESPKNLSTHFQSKKIVLTFDEFVKLNNAQKEISISPAMDVLPIFQAKRKSIEVQLPDSLAENTTYVINFGKAIADNNEGNPFEDYRYVFSTGAEIDSLNIKGKVLNAYTNEAETGISVILIPITQDSIFGRKKANIFATTDSSGNFQLRYLRADEYRIYALKEKNNDRIYNNPDEWIGFLSDSINLKGDTSGIRLHISRPTPKEFRVLDRQITRNGTVYYTFNRPLEDPRILVVFPDSLEQTKQIEFSPNKDSVNLWLADMSFDSLKVHIFDRDSLMDSVLIRRPKSDTYNRNIVLTNNLDRNKVNKVKHLEFIATSPIKNIQRSKIALREDTTVITNYQITRDSLDLKKFTVRANWKPKKNYQITFQEKAIEGYFGDDNKLIKAEFTLEENEKFGDILLKLTLPDSASQYIVELMDESKTRILESQIVTENSSISYKNVPESKYLLRVIYDENKNGKWDPGDLDNQMQPERIWYYDKTFIIRPNWEQSEVITIPPKTTSRQELPPRKKK